MNPSALQEMQLSDPEAAKLFGDGISNAMVGLSQMSGQDIKVTSLSFRRIPVKDIPNLFGGPEALIIAVYLEITGMGTGHIVVAYHPDVAFDLIDLLLGQAPGSTSELSDMERSTLGEVGNIMGSFFLNHISDAIGCRMMPSPPAVMMDMAGAVLDAALANVLAYTDYTYVIDTTFGTNNRQVSGTFLVIPEPGLEAANAGG